MKVQDGKPTWTLAEVAGFVARLETTRPAELKGSTVATVDCVADAGPVDTSGLAPRHPFKEALLAARAHAAEHKMSFGELQAKAARVALDAVATDPTAAPLSAEELRLCLTAPGADYITLARPLGDPKTGLRDVSALSYLIGGLYENDTKRLCDAVRATAALRPNDSSVRAVIEDILAGKITVRHGQSLLSASAKEALAALEDPAKHAHLVEDVVAGPQLRTLVSTLGNGATLTEEQNSLLRTPAGIRALVKGECWRTLTNITTSAIRENDAPLIERLLALDTAHALVTANIKTSEWVGPAYSGTASGYQLIPSALARQQNAIAAGAELYARATFDSQKACASAVALLIEHGVHHGYAGSAFESTHFQARIADIAISVASSGGVDPAPVHAAIDAEVASRDRLRNRRYSRY